VKHITKVINLEKGISSSDEKKFGKDSSKILSSLTCIGKEYNTQDQFGA
jgi:hypothetical protein